MAEIATVARPYAEAVFRLAQESKDLAKWSAVLALLQSVYQHPDMRMLAGNPAFGKEQFADLYVDICGDELDSQAKNFVRVLVSNGRIDLLPEIVAQFEALKARASGVKSSHVVSAFPLTAAQQLALKTVLESRFKCAVEMETSVDSQLIGGVVVTIGDEVYDASVRGKLQDMAYALNR